ncbi:MAG: sigma 54-interacting transcriptional regulator [Desulfosalsimonadaceae bacterium]
MNRIPAATNRSLKDLVEKGRFREDLYYRLNVLDIDIPPLRDRKEDIPAMVTHFFKNYGSSKEKLNPEAESTLMKYAFQGNVRELGTLFSACWRFLHGLISCPYMSCPGKCGFIRQLRPAH